MHTRARLRAEENELADSRVHTQVRAAGANPANDFSFYLNLFSPERRINEFTVETQTHSSENLSSFHVRGKNQTN